MGTKELVHGALGQMTDAERKVAHAFLANYPSTGLSTVAEFAGLAGTSAPTVLQAINKLIDSKKQHGNQKMREGGRVSHRQSKA